MVKAVLARGSSNTRVKLQRWSDGDNRSALLRDVIKISPDEARGLIWKRLATVNRRFALLHAEEIFYGLGLREEIQLFISNLIKDHVIAPAGREFIIELIIQLSWQQTYGEPFVTNHYVYKKVCASVCVPSSRISVPRSRHANARGLHRFPDGGLCGTARTYERLEACRRFLAGRLGVGD
ncbi:hypothetical protein D3C81_474690 [compost metagenome]